MQNYLFFFDEIQEGPKAISALKMINEADLKINLICSGSYLTYQIVSTNFNFPVGQVQNLQMKQMMFDEFIIALGKENLLNLAIESIKVKKEIAPLIHQELLKWFGHYLRIGGFPEVVKTFIEQQYSYLKTYQILQQIQNHYKHDLYRYSDIFSSKHFLVKIYQKINQFLIRENKKFVFQDLDHNAKYRELEKYLVWLDKSNLVIKIDNLKNIQYPLIDKVIDNHFKIYYNDHGFLALDYQLNQQMDQEKFNLIKGALFENFVVSQLLDENKIYYYAFIEHGKKYEVDFVIQNKQNNPCLIEVKSGLQFKLTSLNKIKNYPYKFVLSTNNYQLFANFVNIPIYLAFMLKEIISSN